MMNALNIERTKQAITLTFGDCAENHRGMQIIGNSAVRGFQLSDLQAVKQYFEQIGVDGCKLIHLHEEAVMKKENIILPEGYLLIIPNACQQLINYESLYDEMVGIEWDSKAFMYGRVVNKKARHNLCFDEISQSADYGKGLGTIVAFDEVPELKLLKDRLNEIVPNSGELKIEGNYYYDINKCGIGFHGDSERKKVIGVRLGAEFPLCFQWFYQGEPISERMQFSLGNGDLYIMSEKAVGFDWKRKIIPTLRHSAGCEKFINYIKPIPKKHS
jgi:hypothetical protein